MKNLEEVMNAFARVLEKPRNPLYAMQELMEKLDAHGREALKEWDDVSNTLAALDDVAPVYVTEEVRKAS